MKSILLFLCLGLPVFAGDWHKAGKTGDELPQFILESLKYVPVSIDTNQIVVLSNPRVYLSGYLAGRYDKQAIAEIIKAVVDMSEFTLDHQFPIFVKASSASDNYWYFQKLWGRGRFSDQAAMALASELWHEYQHAAKGLEEADALRAQIALLEMWQQSGKLTIADKYIAAQQERLKKELGH